MAKKLPLVIAAAAALLLGPLSNSAEADLKDFGRAVKSGAKEVGHAVKDGAKEVGHAVKDGAKEVGHATKSAFKGGAGTRSGVRGGGRRHGGGGHHRGRRGLSGYGPTLAMGPPFTMSPNHLGSGTFWTVVL